MSGNSTDKSNSNNSRGTAASALSMARERLQSSAREWIRNIEDAMLSTSSATQSSANASMRDNNVSQRREIQPSFKEGAASIEQAFRIMFASCTGAADANARELEEKSTSTQTPSSDMQSSDSKSCPPMVTPSHSCRYTVPTVSTPSTAPSTRSPPTLKPPPPSQRDFGEHIYAQLFHDDNSRARKAVASLRTEPDINEPPLGRRQPLTPAAAPMYSYPKPFPMSSPPRTSAVPSQELTLPSNLTFDDSISAISAHTLEAMAHHAPRIRSDLTFSSKDSSTLFPPQSSLHSFPRVQSHESNRSGLISKGGSQKSKTTHTTESSGTSFEIWQAQEKEYWNDVVMQEERQKKPDNKSPHSPAENKAPRSPPNWFKRGRKATRHPHDGFAPFADTPFIQPIVKHDFSTMEIDEYEVEIDQDDVAEI